MKFSYNSELYYFVFPPIFLALILDEDFILRLVMFLCRNSSDVLHYVILFFQKATNLQIKSHIKLHHQMRLLLWPLQKILGSSSIGILYFLVGFNSSYLQNDYISCYFFHNCTVVWLFLSMRKLIGFISPFLNSQTFRYCLSVMTIYMAYQFQGLKDLVLCYQLLSWQCWWK